MSIFKKEKIALQAYEKAKGHRKRVKEKFLKEGPEKFTDEDLLELLLMFNIPYKDTRKIARELFTRYKTLDKILDAPLEELTEIKGLKEKSILPLKVIKEVARRYLKSKALNTDYLRSPEEVYNYLKYEMQNLDREILKVIFLDAKSKIIDITTLFWGTITESVIYPREIFAQALEKKAVSIILVHNHPSGKVIPSQHDIDITKKLIFVANFLQIKLLDHIIIGKEGYFSMAENGLIDQINKEVIKEFL